MKYVFLALFVFFASMPVQASACDMHNTDGTSHSQHGDMQMDNMADMDCCDHDSSDSTDSCDFMSQCGAAPASVVTIDSTLVSVAYISKAHLSLANSGHPLSSFNAPPFRPPIA